MYSNTTSSSSSSSISTRKKVSSNSSLVFGPKAIHKHVPKLLRHTILVRLAKTNLVKVFGRKIKQVRMIAPDLPKGLKRRLEKENELEHKAPAHFIKQKKMRIEEAGIRRRDIDAKEAERRRRAERRYVERVRRAERRRRQKMVIMKMMKRMMKMKKMMMMMMKKKKKKTKKKKKKKKKNIVKMTMIMKMPKNKKKSWQQEATEATY
ncbi:hypothetical protein F4703DRAFT_1487058 [Phycomyces blakesleeanus]